MLMIMCLIILILPLMEPVLMKTKTVLHTMILCSNKDVQALDTRLIRLTALIPRDFAQKQRQAGPARIPGVIRRRQHRVGLAHQRAPRSPARQYRRAGAIRPCRHV